MQPALAPTACCQGACLLAPGSRLGNQLPCLFSYCTTQCGHPLHKLNVSADQIERGNCIWDVVQMVPLSGVRVSACTA